MRRPPLPALFRWTAESWGSALRCAPLEAHAQHAFTTKQLQLRGRLEDQPTEWTALAASVGASLDNVMRVRQVHGRAVRIVGDERAASRHTERPDADAVISNVPGLALTVLVADCVPVLLVDPQHGAAAAVHAGWRGTGAGIVSATIDAMRQAFGSAPQHLVAAIGPSIRPCCYEVGAELRDAFRAQGHAPADLERWFTTMTMADGRASLRLDVALANRDQLLAAGVPLEATFDCGLCTKTYRDTFDSSRADGDLAGRMAAMIVVPR